MFAYSEDHGGAFPTHPKHAWNYLPQPQDRLFFSPFQEANRELGEDRIIGDAFRYGSYVFVNLGYSIKEIDTAGERIIAYTAKFTSDQARRSVLFADGHAEIWEEQRLRTALPPDIDVDALDGP
jgi:prepilin-type processing-associated H-X9-DG protein